MSNSIFFVMVDPGHGGNDPGAVAQGLREADINLAVAHELVRVLESSGILSVMTRIGDRPVSLARRVDMERRVQPDLFVSIHCNAAGSPAANGFEVWTSPGITASDYAAAKIYRAWERAFPARRMRPDYSDGFPDREAAFYVLTRTGCPAVLCELGFMTNVEEAAWLSDPDNQRAMARAIAAGIDAWRRRET